MKKIYLVGLSIILILTACSNSSDYELRLVENDSKFTVSTADSTSDTIIYSYVIDNSETIELYLDNAIDDIGDIDDIDLENEFEVGVDHTDGLHDSIVVEEDVIQADIDAMTSSNNATSSTQVADVFTETDEQELDDVDVDDTVEEQELDETDEQEFDEVDEADTIEETDEVEEQELDEADTQELDEVEETDVVDKDEMIFEPIQELVVEVLECTHTEQEHTFTQTLIDYVGRGNYDKWVANAVPTCENGLTIYDYMSYFNMTASFFENLTRNDIIYNDLNLYELN